MSSHTKQHFRFTWKVVESAKYDVYSSKNVRKNAKKNRLWTKKIVRNQWKRASDAQSASSSQKLVLQPVSQSATSASIRRLACVIRSPLSPQPSGKQTKSPVHPTASASGATSGVSSRKTSDQRAFAIRQPLSLNTPEIQTILPVHSMASASSAALAIRQPPACIWPFHGRVQHAWHHIQPPVHLMTSASDAALATSSDNRQRASGRFTVGCSSLAIRQLRQCIWPSGVRCSLSGIRQLRQCIWWSQHQVQHPGITFIWSFPYVTGGRPPYTFIWSSFLTKRRQRWSSMQRWLFHQN